MRENERVRDSDIRESERERERERERDVERNYMHKLMIVIT